MAMNRGPKNLDSFKSIGTLTTAQALSMMTIFETLAPFLSSILQTGNAAYIGPAEKLPRINEKMEPLNPEPSPKPFMMVSLGTHASMSDVRQILRV